MAKAEEQTDFDFMISIVGPSTSVRDQQLQSMEYGANVYQIKAPAMKHLRTYTNLMFDAKSEQYAEMMALLEKAEQEGWKTLLDDTDIPTSATEINNLWVRRHNFDPKEVLSNYEKPFIGIYGERDWIVPQKENIALLNQYFSPKSNLLTTVVAHNAEHGMEMEAKWIDLGQNQTYWHFYRISPAVRIEMIAFLKKHDLLE